ncbi:penicillin acylase family protein [Roseospira marina]|uniref:Penicillin acylase family protein n=1 Tax=Roseospira marina TaxID=140057 RepID=A0A5M6IGE4_9PROT|nr:penicillin acylase family protein [Roseospira marina]KAA5607380.1 penicillin acylase family protein [Roseospira marina]MBB4312450.1 penicillin amidase [Roseospira marina]MBB5085534.1 penicillin amidase [Roseospira marina]
MRVLRWTLRILVGLILLAVLVTAGVVGYGVWAAWHTVPPDSATVRLGDRLSAPVTVHRDALGIPTIHAETLRDATVALGYVHAQDRLWQMETLRRLGAGRMAEIVGSPVVGLDRFMRTLGLHRAARAQWEILNPATRHAAKAYADGVNAFLKDPPSGLPYEFRIAFHTPEPWDPVDSMLWQRFMGLQLSGNWHEELLNTRLQTRFIGEPEAPAFLMRTEPDTPPLLTTASHTPPPPGLDGMLARLAAMTPAAIRPTLASNAWAVDGRHTASGGALLASDPHLGFQVPIRWYLARIETPDLTLEGATFPGVPFVIIGHNAHVAWGFTTTHSDTIDLYRERLGDDAGTYLRPDGPVPFTVRNETITIRFGDSETLTVRETVHGPVLSDLGWGRFQGAAPEAPGTEVIAMAAAALRPNDTTPDALYRLNRARTLDEARTALRAWDAPQQNIVLADATGRVGMVSPGRVPLRAPGHDGRLLALGWTGTMDWQGWQTREDLPSTIDPPSGRVLNANNRIHPVDRVHPLAVSFPEPYRARRLANRLNALSSATPSDMAALQMDIVSAMAADLLPPLLAAADVGAPTHADAAAALDRLRAWDPPEMAADRPEPLILAAWLDILTRRLFQDDLGPVFEAWAGRPRPYPTRAALENAPHWCDDIRTPASEPCPEQVAGALDAALDWIAEETGRDALDARWGDLHRVRMRHDLFRVIPGIAALTGLEAPTDGGDFTLNRGGHAGLSGDRPFEHVHGPGLRAVMDLAPPARGRFIIATGQSANPFSPHYADQFELWRTGRVVRIGGGAETAVLTLTP